MQAATSFASILREKTCIVGMGNPLRNDDAIGVYIAETLQLEKSLAEHLTVISVEDVIENYVFQIAQSEAGNVLLIDAIAMPDARAGAVVFGRLDEFSEKNGEFSTHKLALRMSAKILESYGKTVYLLGVVARNIEYGKEISSEIMRSAQDVIAMMRMARKE